MFCDQFENLANARAHFEGTGPEIWEQVRTLAPTGGEASVTTNARAWETNDERRRERRWFPSFFLRPYGGRREKKKKFLDAFVCACGTGGTLAGVASFLRRADARIECFLVDPQGSSLYNKVTRGVLYTHQEAEGKRLRNPFDTITEGVGINRLTRNFAVALGDEKLFASEANERAVERRSSPPSRSGARTERRWRCPASSPIGTTACSSGARRA